MSPCQTLRLASHVRACHSDGQVILLDLRRSKYLGIGGRQLSALARAVEGWPAGPTSEDPSAVDLAALTAPLLSQGLLTDRPARRPADAMIEEATASLDAESAIQDTAIGPCRIARFVWSAASAAISLRWQSLLSIADAAAARRTRGTKAATAASPETLRNAVAAYEKLRPLAYTARERCLYDSLALLNFLAGEGLFPTWVIGVRTRPFGAHSWLQSGPVVLNDLHDHVRRFRPILVV